MTTEGTEGLMYVILDSKQPGSEHCCQTIIEPIDTPAVVARDPGWSAARSPILEEENAY
jgi:hypothetical protein